MAASARAVEHGLMGPLLLVARRALVAVTLTLPFVVACEVQHRPAASQAEPSKANYAEALAAFREECFGSSSKNKINCLLVVGTTSDCSDYVEASARACALGDQARCACAEDPAAANTKECRPTSPLPCSGAQLLALTPRGCYAPELSPDQRAAACHLAAKRTTSCSDYKRLHVRACALGSEESCVCRGETSGYVINEWVNGERGVECVVPISDRHSSPCDAREAMQVSSPLVDPTPDCNDDACRCVNEHEHAACLAVAERARRPNEVKRWLTLGCGGQPPNTCYSAAELQRESAGLPFMLDELLCIYESSDACADAKTRVSRSLQNERTSGRPRRRRGAKRKRPPMNGSERRKRSHRRRRTGAGMPRGREGGRYPPSACKVSSRSVARSAEPRRRAV